MAIDKEFANQVGTAFGDVLRQARARQRVSQQDLALDSGLDRTYVSLLERGLRQPTLAAMFLLANTLGVEPASLIKKTTEQLERLQA